MCGGDRMHYDKKHADCDFAKTEHLEEWRDRWGQAHEHEIVRCMLTGQPNYGHCFTASDPQPDACSWARILIKQAKEG